jgi:hypothetical protein
MYPAFAGGSARIGIQWESRPQELGFGFGTTCWRRLDECNQTGVWRELQELPLAQPSPVDRARPGSEHGV